MFCSNCGKQIEDGARFCPYCGGAQPGGGNDQGAHVPNNCPAQSSLGNQYTWNTRSSGVNAGTSTFTPATQHPMKWYKFIIYVQLFLSALLNVITAVTYFTGSIYESSLGGAALVYAYYSGLQAVDYFYALCLLVLAVAAIAVRMMLAHYKKKGPSMYVLLLIVSQSVGLLYTILVGIITRSWSAMPLQIGCTIGVVIFVALNSVYFSKRADLFVN